MSRAGIPAICEQEIFSRRGFYGHLDPGVWRPREKWKTLTRVRLPGISGLVWSSRCAAVQNGGALLGEKKVQVRSRFATTAIPSIGDAAKLGPGKVTGTEADEVSPVPWTDAEGLADKLPLKVSAGVVLESLGALYEGPNKDKYWTQNRYGLGHPYPVGYTATKTYKGVQFKQTIEKGPDGPIFVVGEVNKTPCSADSPARAWSLALAISQLNSSTRVHGRKHFGFDYPIVLGYLSQMGQEQVVKEGLVENRNGGVEAHDPEASNRRKDGKQFDAGERLSSALQLSALSLDSGASAGPRERSIRLRSVRVEDTLHERVQVLSCQDATHPVTRGFFQEPLTSLSNEDSTIADEESSPSGRRTNTSSSLPALDTSLDSILRRMDEVARNDEQGSLRDSDSRIHDDSEKKTHALVSEQKSFKQNSTMSRFFSPTLSRARILSEESTQKDTRKTAQTRSLANLLEEWNKGGRPHSLRNGKPDIRREGDSQLLRRPTKVDRMLLTREEQDESVFDTRVETSMIDSPDVDIQRMVDEWCSGNEGQSSVLREIQQLVANRCVDQALQVLKMLHSSGARVDDAAYSALFPYTFDDWQKQTVRHVLQGKSVLVCASGGAGKFVVAMRCLYESFVQGERCLVVTPYEALAEDRCQQLAILFGGKNVGRVPSKEEDRKSLSPITVITLDNLVKELREGRYNSGSSAGNSFLEGLSLVVMDRFHTFGEATSGGLWEEAIMFLDHEVKLIALSLPTKTSNDIAPWISSIHRPCERVVCECEPVQKCWYSCDSSGLHLLGNDDEKLLSSKSWGSLTVEAASVTDFQESIRHMLQSFEMEAFLPLAISFSSIEDCITAANVAHEVITEGYISAEERACIEERVQHFFRENAYIEPFVNKDDVKCLSQGFGIYHDAQVPLWTNFVQGLVCDNLVRMVFGTNTMLCSTRISFRSVALCLISEKSGKSSMSSSDFTQLCGKAGRRGRDTSGNVVSIGGKLTWATKVDENGFSVLSHFKPSYSLLLNLLSRHTLSQVKHFVESNYAEYLVKKQMNECQELKELDVQISDVAAQKQDLEAQLFQKLQKLNTTKLQDATIFTHVDVRVATSEPHGADAVVPGVLCAVLPGPSKLLYVILCADNIFRLLPAGALDHVYTKEKPLDAVYKSSTGHTLRAPPLPLKEKWTILPGDFLVYTADGTRETAHVVDVLNQYGVKFHKTENESNCREEIRSCNGLLSTLHQEQETILSRPTITWAKSEKLIETLVKADAVELAPKDSAYATIKPLGVLTSKLHHVENELWFTMALSSSIVKPLTAPELAAICSALLFTSGETGSESPDRELEGSTKVNIAHDTPKRLRASLEKLEILRNSLELLQGSNSPPLRLDGGAVAAVHSLCRESVGQGPADDLKYEMVLFVQKVMKLLHDIDDVWGRSLLVLSKLDGTSGLHNLARRAAHLLQKAIEPGR